MPSDIKRVILEYDCALNPVWQQERKKIRWQIALNIHQPYTYGDNKNMHFDQQWAFIQTLADFQQWQRFMSYAELYEYTFQVNTDAWNEHHNTCTGSTSTLTT